LRQWILGSAAAVRVDATVLELKGTAEEAWGALPAERLEETAAASFRAWFSPTNSLAQARAAWDDSSTVRVVATPRAVIGEGVHARLSIVQSTPSGNPALNSGLVMDVVVQERHGRYEQKLLLLRTALFTNALNGTVILVTNLAVALELAMPQDQAFVLLENADPSHGVNRQAVLVTVRPN
jgi:hypothetical protein